MQYLSLIWLSFVVLCETIVTFCYYKKMGHKFMKSKQMLYLNNTASSQGPQA